MLRSWIYIGYIADWQLADSCVSRTHISLISEIYPLGKLVAKQQIKRVWIQPNISMHPSTLFLSRQERKINKTGLGLKNFSFELFIQPKYSILDIDKQNTIFIHFCFIHSYLCIKLITNKLQALPCKVSEKSSVRCGDYSTILVLYEIFISCVCIFKIHVTCVN